MKNNLVRPEILKMKNTNWGEIPDGTGLRLLWGENPIVPKVCIEEIKKEIKKINLYPSPTQKVLKEKLAEYTGLRQENIIVTNGSDDAIELLCKVFINNGDEVIIPTPTFPIYYSSSMLMGAKIKTIPLEKDFSLDIAKILNALSKKTKIIWIANPNNPTGNMLLTEEKISKLALKANCIIAVDECYFEQSGISFVNLINKFPNIIIIRSFSKSFALAGLRLGYIVGSKNLAEFLSKLKQTNEVFSVNRLSIAAGTAILSDKKSIIKQSGQYKKLKADFEDRLRKIKGIKVIETKTNFSLLDIQKTKITSKKLKTKLEEKNILIKDCSIYAGFGNFYVYLGVPAKKYQKQFIGELEKIIRRKYD